MVCPIVNAIAVSLSKVYNDAQNDIDGDVHGATTPELAKCFVMILKKHILMKSQSFVGPEWAALYVMVHSGGQNLLQP